MIMGLRVRKFEAQNETKEEKEGSEWRGYTSNSCGLKLGGQIGPIHKL